MVTCVPAMPAPKSQTVAVTQNNKSEASWGSKGATNFGAISKMAHRTKDAWPNKCPGINGPVHMDGPKKAPLQTKETRQTRVGTFNIFKQGPNPKNCNMVQNGTKNQSPYPKRNTSDRGQPEPIPKNLMSSPRNQAPDAKSQLGSSAAPRAPPALMRKSRAPKSYTLVPPNFGYPYSVAIGQFPR